MKRLFSVRSAFACFAILTTALVGCGESDDAADESSDALKATGTATQTLSCTGTTVDDNGYPAGEMDVTVTIADPRAETLKTLTMSQAAKRITVSFSSPYEIKLNNVEIPADDADYLAINGYTAHSHFAVWVPVTALGKSGDSVKDVSGYWSVQGPSVDATFTCKSTVDKK